jgi:hypothetical protein
MDEELLATVINPITIICTEHKVGLGIPSHKQTAEISAGKLEINTTKGMKTKITTKFQHCHFDQLPLGDLADNFLSLLLGTPEVNQDLNYQLNNHSVRFYDTEAKHVLDDIPLTDYRKIIIPTTTKSGGIENTYEIGSKQGVSYAHN